MMLKLDIRIKIQWHRIYKMMSLYINEWLLCLFLWWSNFTSNLGESEYGTN